MYKLILLILLTFVFVQSVYSQTFEVKAVSGDLKEAVLYDRETGEEWVVRKGEEIRGWRVWEIAKGYVTIVRTVEGGAIAAQIPVGVRRELMFQNR